MKTSKYLEKFKEVSNSEKIFYTTTEISQLFDISKKRTLEDLIKRLRDEKVLIRIEKGKYYFSVKSPSDFEIAQFLNSKSYISFETGLNYHGILKQFPFEITSASLKNTKVKVFDEKVFSYSKISKNLFTGYYKENGFLIAYPEKALFDQIYFISKSVKSKNYLDEMDYTRISWKKFGQYYDLVSIKTKNSMHKLLAKYI